MAHLKQNKQLNLRYLIRMKQLAVIIAQLAERSLPTPEGTSSNPAVNNFSDQNLPFYC